MRKDEPSSFSKRLEDDRKRNSNASTDYNFINTDSNLLMSPKKLENSSSSSMLARVGSQSILQGSGSSMLLNPNRYANMNLSVKIDKSNYQS